MLLVEESMTREVIALKLNATAVEALVVCRARQVRHLPVLEKGRSKR